MRSAGTDWAEAERVNHSVVRKRKAHVTPHAWRDLNFCKFRTPFLETRVSGAIMPESLTAYLSLIGDLTGVYTGLLSACSIRAIVVGSHGKPEVDRKTADRP